MPFCPRCGSQVSEDAQYCPNCGAPLGKPEPTTTSPTPEARAPAARSFFGRIYGAAALDTSVYEEVEADRTATTQALLVVILASISQGIGTALSNWRSGPTRAGVGFFEGLFQALLLWAIWSFVTYFVGTRLFGGRATYGELLRTIGFANSPNLLGIFTFIPILGGILSFALWIWALAAMIIAVRQALDFSTGKAIMTCIVGFIAAVVLLIIVAIILAIPLILFNL